MSKPEFDDAILMAFADGELDEATRRAVEEAMASDDALVERVGMFVKTAALSRQAFEPLVNAPVPDALRADIEAMVDEHSQSARNRGSAEGEEKVVAFAPPPGAARGRFAQWAMPLAASIALIVGGFAGYMIAMPPGGDGGGGLTVAALDQPGLVEALGGTPSGSEITLDGSGDRLRMIASYRDGDDRLCREFEVDRADRSTFVSVACSRGVGWELRFTVAAASQSEGGYAPASSLESLDAYLTAVGAGAPLSDDAERAALQALPRSSDR